MHILCCVLYGYADRPDLHSFPTRRSSDLAWALEAAISAAGIEWEGEALAVGASIGFAMLGSADERADVLAKADHAMRSEEHTSELQSRENLVCRLLLEKKKLANKILQQAD